MKKAGLLPSPSFSLRFEWGRGKGRGRRGWGKGSQTPSPLSILLEEAAPARNCLFLVVIMILDEAIHASRHIGRLRAKLMCILKTCYHSGINGKTCFDKRACSIRVQHTMLENLFAFTASLNHYIYPSFIFFSSHRHRAMCAIERRDRPPNYPPDGGRGEWAICQGKKGRKREGMVSVRCGMARVFGGGGGGVMGWADGRLGIPDRNSR